MNTARIKTTLTALSIAAVMILGSGSTYAQKRSFGGKSFSGKSFSSSSSSRSRSSSFGGSSKSKQSFGQSSSGRSTTKPSFSNNSGFSRQQLTTKGNSAFQQNRGSSTTKPSSRTDLWKTKLGSVNQNTSKIDNGKSPIDLKGKVNTRDIKNQVTDRFQHHIKHNQQLGKVCVDNNHWCHAKPKQCHWWYNWCKPIRYCEPTHYVNCHWNYVTCDYVHAGQVVVADARWYLGMKGLLLPGQGIGIEEVAPGSPAAQVGLTPGMVITRCNGIDLFDEAALGDAISQSGGVLQMDLRLSAGGPPATCVVVMQRVASQSY